MKWLARTVTAGVAAIFVLLAIASPGDRFGWQVSLVTIVAVAVAMGSWFLWARRAGDGAVVKLSIHPLALFLLLSSAVYTLLALDAGHLTMRPTPDLSDFVPGLFSDLKVYYLSVQAAVCAFVVVYGHRRNRLLELGLAVQVVFLAPLYEPVLQTDAGAPLMLGSAIVFAAWALADGKELGLAPFRWTLVAAPMAAFLGVALLAVIPAAYVQHSLIVWAKLASLTMLVLLAINVVREERQFWLLGAALVLPVVATAVQILYKLVEIGNHMGIEYAVRYRFQFLGLVGANTVGLAISVAMLLVVAGLFRTDRLSVRVVLALLLVPLFPVMLSLRSASSLVSVAVVVMVPVIAANRELLTAARRLLNPVTVLAVLTGAVVLGALIAIPNAYRSEWQDELSDPTTGRGVRSNVWVWSVEDFQHNAILGVGPSDRRFEPRTQYVPEFTFRKVTSLGERRQLLGGSGTYWRLIVWGHPHNIVLLVAETTGVVGLAALFWLLGSLAFIGLELTFKRMTSDRWLITVAIAGVGACLAGSIFALGQDVAYLPLQTWPLLGLVGAGWRRAHPAKEAAADQRWFLERLRLPPVFTQGAASALGAVLVVAFLGLVARPAIAETIADEARDARQENNVPRAIDRFEMARRFDPLDADDLRELGLLDVRSGDVDAGLSMMKRLVDVQPQDAVNYVMLGWLQWYAGDRAAAQQSFDRSVDLDPWNALSSNNLMARGLALAASGKRDDAIASFKQAVYVDPTVVKDPAWISVQTKAGGEDRAVDPAYLSQQQGDRLTLLLLHRLNLPASEVPAASPPTAADKTIYLSEVVDDGYAEYEATLASDRERALGELAALARAASVAGMGDRALELALEVQREEPEKSHSHYELGLAYVALGDDDQGETAFREAVRIAEASAAYDVHKAFGHYQLGLLYQRRRDHEAALKEFRTTLAQYRWPYFPEAYLALAEAARQTGHVHEAETVLGRLEYLLGSDYVKNAGAR